MEVKYVMVTHWGKHWDALENQETYYTKKMINFEVNKNNLVENAPTLFIKRKDLGGTKAGDPERAWVGSVHGFRGGPSKIIFKVKIDKEVPLSQVPKEYLWLESGWYLKDWYLVEK